MLCVDYLQLVHSGQRLSSEYDEISAVSRGLKAISKDLSIPVLCIAQLNRSSEREARRPNMSDLRGSGQIEQDADGIMFIHVPEEQNHESEMQRVEIIVAKRRQGETGMCTLLFDKKRSVFVDERRD